jgi:orotate phosphoribosyltransferase
MKMAEDQAVMKILADAGAIITGSHIVYTSGRHGTAYVNKDALYVHSKSTASLCQKMAAPYEAQKIDVVAGPTVGGVILSQWVAYYLNQSRTSGETLSVYAEEDIQGDNKNRIFKRGYDVHVRGKNVLVVEDVVTTGGSARKVVEAIRALAGNVVGLSVLCNRGGIKPEDVGGVPIHSLTNVQLDSYEAPECPMCKEKVPINTSIGKGREFLEKQKGLAVS